jgi:hypothetical protein
MDKKAIWTMDINTYIEIVELAQAHGKKQGENLQEEFEEVLSRKQNQIKFLGVTDQDKDLLIGNLRENGVKIMDLDEIERQNKLK